MSVKESENASLYQAVSNNFYQVRVHRAFYIYARRYHPVTGSGLSCQNRRLSL